VALCTLKFVRLTRSRLALLCLYSLESGFPFIQSTFPIPLLYTCRFIGQYHLYNTSHHIKIHYVAIYKSPRVYAIIHTRISHCRYSRFMTCVAVHTLASSSRPALLLGHVYTPSLSHFSCICFVFLQTTHSLLVIFCRLGCGEKCAVLVPQCLYTIINKVLEHQFRCVKAMDSSLAVR
jgi:hypothetical protein